LGGEPTLHEGISEFLLFTRVCFKDTEIRLYTNGLTLKKLPKRFWDSCRESDTIVYLTKYPHLKDGKAKELEDFVLSKGVRCAWPDNDPVKVMTHMPLDLDGAQDPAEAFVQCYHGNRSIQLKDGRLYSCPVSANAGHFNAHFKKELETAASDSIDIYADKIAKEDIFKRLSEPISFCRYCDVKNRKTYDWKPSTRSVEEWT
jgi:MoaA/NifB/PqqE/SkfB family radical SAM enzyme